MSGFPRPVTSAQIVAAGALLAANNLSDVVSAGTSRTNLGLGTAATQPTSAFDAAGAAAAVQALSLQKASNLSDVAAAATALVNLNGVARTVPINAQVGTTYTLALADLGKLVTLTNASPVTLTVPTNASVAFSVGDEILIAQRGAGQVTVAGAGGVTVNPSATLKITGQYHYACLTKLATDTWDLVGDITA